MTNPLASSLAQSPLEPVTAAFAATLDAPAPYELRLEQARAGLHALQVAAPARPPASIEERVIPGGPTGEVPVRIVRPLVHPADSRQPSWTRDADSASRAGEPSQWCPSARTKRARSLAGACRRRPHRSR
jgi:hypothetical protein